MQGRVQLILLVIGGIASGLKHVISAHGVLVRGVRGVFVSILNASLRKKTSHTGLDCLQLKSETQRTLRSS